MRRLDHDPLLLRHPPGRLTDMSLDRATLETLVNGLGSEDAVETAWLFGSGARPGETPRDIDLAIRLRVPDEDALRVLLGLGHRLERAAGQAVDLHDISALPLQVRFRILGEGKLLLDRDAIARQRWEVATMMAYWDFEPYLKRMREATLERLTRGTGDGR